MLKPGFAAPLVEKTRPMLLVRSLIRLMLCLSLILNGSVQTLAGEALHAQGQHGAQASVEHAAPACHDAVAGLHSGSAIDAAADFQAVDAESADCCQSSDACDCACQQHSPVATCLLASLVTATGDTRVVLPVKAGHPSPEPARSIRPPIA